MRYVQLRAFHHVAVCGGFSRAAESLHLTQPAISDQVRKLEEQYDVLLFNRRKKQVTLTQAGAKLLEVTRRLFENERQAQELLSDSRALRSGVLRIVADSAQHLQHILGAFHEAYPGVEITVRTGNSEAVVAQLHNYEAEVGVLGELPAGREFETIRLNSTPLVAFVSNRHLLAGCRSMTLAELASQPLVLREPGSKTRQKLELTAAARGLRVKAAIEAEGREAVREIVTAGVGVGIVSAAEFDRHARLKQIEISDCQMFMDEALIALRERARGTLVRALLDIARAWAAPGAGRVQDKEPQ